MSENRLSQNSIIMLSSKWQFNGYSSTIFPYFEIIFPIKKWSVGDFSVAAQPFRAIRHWGQRPPEDSANEGENNGPLDEIEFWNARDKSLSG